MKIKPIFHHYTKWEDYKHGMYSSSKVNFDKLVEKSVELLKNNNQLYKAMKDVTDNWKYSTEENLYNVAQNARPWLGRSSCCYNHGANEDVVRVAWFMLSHEEMEIANKIADTIVSEWRASKENVQMNLFGGLESA